jgi:hypothetical protein
MTTDICIANTADPRTSDDGYLIPESVALERWTALLLFVLTCLFLCIFLNYTSLNGDEGIILQGAQRVADGQVLYRDFFSFYTPGSYYFIALLFKLFGSSMLVARAELVFCGGAFSVFTYLLARRVCSRWSALLGVYAIAMTCLPFRFLITHWDSTLLCYLSLYFAVLWIETGSLGWAFATGSFAGITAIFEQSAGLGVVLGLACGFALLAARDRANPALRIGLLTVAIVGFVWPWIATFTYFGMMHGLRDMMIDCLWPLSHYSVTNSVPYGFVVTSATGSELWAGGWIARAVLLFALGPLLTIPLLPIVGAGVFFWSCVRRWPGECNQKRAYWLLVSALLTGLLISTLLTKRADFTHLVYLAPLFYLVLPWVLDGLHLKSRLWQGSVPVIVLYVFLSSMTFGIAMLSAPLRAHHKIKTVRGNIRTDDGERSLEYVQARVKPGQKMLVYPYEPLYYYLTGTVSPSRFDFLQLGMHTSDQFQESLRALAMDRTAIVLFETSVAEKLVWTSPDTPLQLMASRDPVQDFIFAHYRSCAAPMTNQYWRFLFMVRKDLSCPQREAQN